MTPDSLPASAEGRDLTVEVIGVVQPFPVPGDPLATIQLAYDMAAEGQPEHARGVPPSWDPATAEPADVRQALWAWLGDVVCWVNDQQLWNSNRRIPTCWTRHPHLIHEVAVLADQRRRAGAALSSDLLDVWQRLVLPAFLERMRAEIGEHCDTGHQPRAGEAVLARDGARANI